MLCDISSVVNRSEARTVFGYHELLSDAASVTQVIRPLSMAKGFDMSPPSKLFNRELFFLSPALAKRANLVTPMILLQHKTESFSCLVEGAVGARCKANRRVNQCAGESAA